MMDPRELNISDFTYDLPDEKIARYPLPGRDQSKLLVFNKGDITESRFNRLPAFLPPGALLVFNQTKVIHARLLFRKPTGSVIEIFCLAPHSSYPGLHIAMQQQHSVLWECLVGGAQKWKPGTSLSLVNESPAFTLQAWVEEKMPGACTIRFEWTTGLTFAEVLHFAGQVPLPPYLGRGPEAGDESNYQTTFAREEGSVAAPTAGLHFTEDMFQAFDRQNMETVFVTLHVGAGTFKPVKRDTLAGHEMHAEWMEVTRATLEHLQSQLGQPVIAVGTTSLRTLESLYWIGAKITLGLQLDLHGIAIGQWDPYEMEHQPATGEALSALLRFMESRGLQKIITRTQVMIAPGYDFKIVTGLVTNFHQPQSTLLVLIAALIGDRWKEIYKYALSHDFRFLSYGDGSLLLP